MKANTLLLIALLLGAITFNSCQKVEGCTNPDAENYNADADTADNSCIFSRDKFLNEYAGIIKCPTPLPPESEFRLVISEGLSGDNVVQIEFKDIEDLPIPILEGTAAGDSIVVPKGTYEVPLGLDPQNPDALTEVQMSAVANYLSETTISGRLDIEVFTQVGQCTYEASKN